MHVGDLPGGKKKQHCFRSPYKLYSDAVWQTGWLYHKKHITMQRDTLL